MQAAVYSVQGAVKGKSSLAGLDQFDLKQEQPLPADVLLTTPNTSLYSFDDETRRAVFVETLPEADLTVAPFYYRAQKDHAQRVFYCAVRYLQHAGGRAARPDPAWCCSTPSGGAAPRCSAMPSASSATSPSLSEPDVYTCAVGMRPPDGSRDAELTEPLAERHALSGFQRPRRARGRVAHEVPIVVRRGRRT